MKRKKDFKLFAEFFTWLFFMRNGVIYADGRGNRFDVGKHSLGTKDHDTAVDRVKALDRSMAIKHRLIESPATAAAMEADVYLLIVDGWERYIVHCARPAALGGVTEGTLKRYRAVRDKFVIFAKLQQIAFWQQVNDRQVVAYATYLAAKGYADNTLVLEIDLIKTVIKWLIGENVLPPTAKIKHTTRKSEDSTRYCFSREEVAAMMQWCWQDTKLHWLHDVLLFLTLTGARIGELRQLPWSLIDLDAQIISFVDNRGSALAKKVGAVRTTKGKRGRRVPIHPMLEAMLRRRLDACGNDTVVFRGPEGGQLSPDGVLVALKRDVIKPLSKQFPTPGGEIGFEHGTTHSLRHVFVSQAFMAGANESEIGDWVGHKSSRITRRYRHLGQQDSIRRMRQLDLLTTPSTPATSTTASTTAVIADREAVAKSVA